METVDKLVKQFPVHGGLLSSLFLCVRFLALAMGCRMLVVTTAVIACMLQASFGTESGLWSCPLFLWVWILMRSIIGKQYAYGNNCLLVCYRLVFGVVLSCWSVE
ncbi:unnamed protein product [Ilex paraguariensis]|uniref:Uncharacterized protein n=1 Tax=Ilex paraguariensis TaxID=185542 RepID=A0ABC8TNL2_9AQUA